MHVHVVHIQHQRRSSAIRLSACMVYDVWAVRSARALLKMRRLSIGETKDKLYSVASDVLVDRSTCTADFLLPQVQRQHFIPAGG